ncbi:hypothetical protein A0H81_03029 [Grifola frondosa]|uniref:Uncharacterized protein n=1 Tax=Grifola frondosa TaxID=5627 RepID=A0A1C7MH59_GRIFR|nr:hypothetical protein A0H81_03029 [Grifola frondosa]
MTWIPEPPIHLDKEFRYHDDGMLHAFEYAKWPQAYCDSEPHIIAAPLCPTLAQFGISDRFRMGPAFPVMDDEHVLPDFEDVNIAWMDFNPMHHFRIAEELPNEAVGSLSPSLLQRFRATMIEAKTMAGRGFADDFRKLGDDVHDMRTAKKVAGMFRFQKQRCDDLKMVFDHLKEVPMSSFDTLLWFREFQRVLLDLRAFIIYREVIVPRLNDVNFKQPQPVLPLRGVITSHLHLVSEMYRVGVPVWYVRDRVSITERTLIVRVETLLLAGVCFSSAITMKHGQHLANAPLWVDAPMAQVIRGSLQERLRRFSLTSRPILRPLETYSAGRVGDFEKQQHRSSPQIAGPDHPRQELVDLTADDVLPASDNDHVIMVTTQATEQYGSSVTDVGGVAVGADIEDNVSAEKQTKDAAMRGPSMSVGMPSAYMARKSLQTRTAHKKGKSTNHRIVPPSWVPPYAPGWANVLKSCEGLTDDDHVGLVYALPPIHIFFSAESPLTEQRAHNWLRVRIFCFQQILSPPAHRMVLMTTQQWRIALEGKYFAIEYEHSHVEPESAKEHIIRLPPPPPQEKRPRQEGKMEAGQIMKNANAKRVADRVDINVRFGIHGGFPPYSADCAPAWGDVNITRQMLSADRTVFVGIVWELALFNFRLELIFLDRQLVPYFYNHSDQRLALRRERVIYEIWNSGGVRPMWTDDLKCDRLTSVLWDERREAVKQMAIVMKDWPDGQHLLWTDQCSSDFDAYSKFETEVFTFYVEAFHGRFGRIPHVPLEQPLSLGQFRK